MAFLWSISAYNAGNLGLENENTDGVGPSAIDSGHNIVSENTNIAKNIKETMVNILSKPKYVGFFAYVVVAGSCLGCMNIHFLLLDELGQEGNCDSFKAVKFRQESMELPFMVLKPNVE